MSSVMRGFNPLHCGAVVASFQVCWRMPGASVVSIPFIAGQWSLLLEVRGIAYATYLVSIPFIAGQWSLRDAQHRATATPDLFQSPSLRGSGRFPMDTVGIHDNHPSFNPLHCGAVVASSWGARVSTDKNKFQSPSLRGSGRFEKR